MSRTVTAIFSSRSEAESARLRLGSAVKVQSAQVLARETVAALDNLPVDRKDAQSCREALQAGDHVLVATIARGEPETQIIDALTVSGDVETTEGGPRLSYDIGAVGADGPALRPSAKQARAIRPSDEEPAGISGIVTAARDGGAPTSRPRAPAPEAERQRSSPAVAEKPQPEATKVSPEIRIGQPRSAQGAGKVSAMEASPGHFESRTPARRLSQEEVEAGGLLKNRVIEVVEMREEPVISKEVVVREEVVIRKAANERIETVDDTVRRTGVEAEELSS